MRSISLTNCDRSLSYTVEVEQAATPPDTIYGLLIALMIIGLWVTSLIFLMQLNLAKLPIWTVLLGVIWQMFLFTGLFITAHDAMHGTVYRQNSQFNHRLGAIAVWLYCFFSYPQLLRKHWLHHHYPASDRDPDYHDGKKTNGILWYFHFMKGYWTWQQFNNITIVFNLAHFLGKIPFINLVSFWIVPLILSSLQLFYWGTYLPHREPKQGYLNPHRARTIPLPVFLSFIACYHFGYHQEHHEYPHVPWWQLPIIYQQNSPLRG